MKKFLLTYLFLVPSLMAFGQITYNVTTITELRNAIISANSDGAVSIINLENASYTVGRFGNGPDGGGIAFPEITENFDLIINGDESDITVATTGTYRFFYVTSTGRLILNKLFLYNGQPEDDYAAGAVYNEGYLEANNVLFQGHRSGGNDGNNAGAIYNEGDAYFRTCEFVSNVAQGLGGLRGGAIFNTGLSSTLTVEQCTFYQNSAIGRGSALGINNGSVDVINSTFYENTDEAIYLAGGQLVLNSCTISGNEANNFGGDNGTVVNEGGSLFLRYNIIGQNETSGGSLVITDPNVYDIKGSFTDFGYNVIGQFNTGSLAGTSVNTSILFFDFPGFGYNGSSIVRTIPILASSPALDFVPTSQGSLPGYDQRGYVYEGAAADAGAYELNGTTITSIATGNWSEAGIWSNNDGPFSSLPTIIATGTVVTMNQNGSTGGLEIDGGGNLNAGTFNLSISGDFNASTSPSNSLANLSNANIFFSNVATYTDPVGLDFGNVTVSGSSLDLANPLRARSITINSTRTLNANGNNIEIFGTGGTVWSQLGTFNPGGAGQTVTFTGAAPTINGTNFQNLTINSSGTATSLNDLTMAEQLDVTAGSFVGGVLVQTNGDITINTTGNVDQSDMDSQGGNISVISSAGSLTLGDVTTGAGDCSFTANGDITLALIDASAFGQGGTVSINSGAGSIDVNTITTESTGGSSSGGDVNITTSGPAGDITLGGNILTSGENGAGSVFINSPQSTVSGSSTNIESLATFGFGFTIEVTGRDGVTGFANITGRGNVTIGSNLGDVSVTDVDSNGGSLEISASGNISAGALSTTFGNAFGNLNMNGSGNATVTSITTGPSTSGSGDISVLLGGSFDVTSGLLSSATNSATAAGAIDITAGGDFVASAASLLDLISTDGSTDGGSITLNIGGNILDPLSFRTDGATTAGNVSVSTTGSGATNISTLTMTGGPGGNGSFAANVGGDLIISDVNGVNTSVFFGTGRPVDVSAEGNISISGPINSSSSNGDGGNISLTSNSGEVLFSYINAQSPSANGGNVTLSAFTNVIGSASFSNLNGNNASISTVGATSSGSVFISHNDGNPQDFEISQGATSNGLFSSLAADPLVASDNFLNSTVVGGNYTSGDTRVVIRSPGPPFVTTWQTTTPGESITVPTLGGPYLYDVDWGDGSPVETGFTGNAQHNYATAGTYTVSISGTFPRIYFADGGDKDKIRTIEQWGNIAWTSMGQAFQGCSNLTYNASDVPDLTLVTDISLMFAGATSFNGDISAWNTTGITFMLGTFSGATSFNQNLTGWNVSNVTTMQEMFSGATSFNNGEASGASGSPLTWTTSSLQNTNAMFLGASSFNQNVNSWDVSGVTDMFRMFESATVFNQPLNTWDVSLVTSMGSMFKNATAFNQPLNSATWNTANVVNFGEMFFGASAFDQPLDNNWSVASTVNLVQMFAFATSFNQPLNQWGATKPSNAPIVLMFEGATSFNQPLSAWNVSGTDNMFGIFKNAAAFDQDLSGWDVTGVTVAGASMEELFDNSGMSPTSYDATLLGWSAQTVQPNIVLGVAGLNFCDPTGRDILLGAPNNWTIIGDNPLVDRSAVPQASQLTICDGDSFDFDIGSGVQTGYTYKLYSEFVDLGNRGNEVGTWTEGSPLSAVTLTAGSNGIVVGDNLLIVVAEDNSSICEVMLDASLTITVNPLPTVAISGDATICEGESTDLLFTLTGTGPYDVTYNDGTVDVDLIGISDGHLESVAPTSTTTYTLISMADANSCSSATVTGSVEVTVNPLPTVVIGGGVTICEGESTDLLFTLTGTGPFDVTYNDGTADVDLIGISDGHLESVAPTSTTTYTLISVADANSCSPATVTGSATVTINPAPTVSISGDATICEGESTDLLFTLTGAGPFDVTYNDGTADVDLIGISDGHLEAVMPTSTTTYSLISVTDANTCSPSTVTGSAQVTVNPLPTVAISGDVIICDGESTDLLFTLTGTGPFDVTYNDGTADVDLIGISDGHLESVAPISTTTYTLISVADANSCSPATVTGSATVTINPAPTVSISGDATICEGESTDLLFTLTGAGPFDVTYNDGTADVDLIGISDGHLEPVTPTVTTTYTLVSLVDANNCSSSGVAGSVTVTVNPLPVITLDAQGPFCLTDATTDLVATPSGGTWSGTGITDAATGTFDPAGVGAGTYTITYEISENGCTDFASIDVAVFDTPDASINPAGPFCTSDAPVNLTSVNSGGTWSGSGITDQAAGTFDPNQSGTGLITVTYTLELGGCSDVQTLNIEVNESPEVVIGEVSAICISDAPITLTATPSGGIWSGSGITDANNGTFDPTVAGLGTSTISYSVNNNGCSGESEIEIEILSLPENATAINGPDFLCTGDEALYTTTAISGATQYEWQTPSGTIVTDLPEIQFSPAASGQLSVAGINDCGTGQAVSKTFDLLETSIANFEFATSPTSDLEYNFIDASTGNVNSWSWDFGDGSSSSEQNPSHTYDVQGEYTVTLTSSNGACEDIATQTINVSTEIVIRIGNVITPNNNGQNDFIYIEDIEKYPDHEVQLLNRWGKQVYSTTRFSNNIDEMPNIPQLSGGNYVCRVIIRFGGVEVKRQQVISVIE